MSDIQATQTEITTDTPVEAVEQQEAVPKQPDHSWVPKRISEITAARRAAEDRAARLEAELAQLRSSATQQVEGEQQIARHDPNFEQLVNARAEALLNQRRSVETMDSRIAEINAAGAKEFGDDYEKSVQNLQMAGVGGPEFLKVLTSVEGAEKLVTYLGKAENLNDAMRVMSMDPVQMAVELTKMAPKAAKALSKQVSKAPPPATTIDGSGASDGSAPDPSDTAAWMKWRSSNRKTRR
jgi:flagellar motility protein MotE (MotC chaperone)